MAKAKDRIDAKIKRGKLTEPQPFPIDPFELFKQTKLVQLINVKDAMEDKWGINRLQDLCEPSMREKLMIQLQRIWAAQNREDYEKAVNGMVRGYKALEVWAESMNLTQIPQVNTIEHECADGGLLVVVATKADAENYIQFRPSTNTALVFDMEEIELLVKAKPLQELLKLKQFHPNARMVAEIPAKVVGSGFDDLESDLDFGPTSQPMQFDITAAEKYKKESK